MADSNTPFLLSGSKTVTTAGTRVTLVSASKRVPAVIIIAKENNTGRIFIGGADVDSSTARGLLAKQGIKISSPNLNLFDINLDASVSGEGVDFYAVKG